MIHVELHETIALYGIITEPRRTMTSSTWNHYNTTNL